MQRKRLLISDNYKDFVHLLVAFFSKQPDIEIIGIAYNGNQVLKMIDQTNPDILLLDLIMPELDGLEVLKKIREMCLSLRVLVVSAVGKEEMCEMAIELGAEQCFLKPANLNEILNSIRNRAS
jgi:two-component system response regulator (stage 0 sporulation protein A)